VNAPNHVHVGGVTGSVALFPGQGSLPADARSAVAEAAPDLLERCAALVGEDPFPRAAESTRFAQPAIFCASMAGWARLPDHERELLGVAGHSLGELAALVAAGVLTLDDALGLVVLRGRLMAEAAEARPGGSMLAVLGAGAEDIKDAADEHNLALANHNAPGQIVLSGDAGALKAVGAVARERGLRVIALDVAGAFHSLAMQPAVEGFAAALAEVELHPAAITPYSASCGKPFEDVRAELAQALVRPVRWVQTVEAMAAAGATRFIDIGPGKVVAGLAKRIVRGAEVVTLQEVAGAAV